MKITAYLTKTTSLTPLFLLCFTTSVCAQSILKGKVTDAKNGEPLIGATVHIEDAKTQLNTAVKLDGSYLFKNVPAGTYQLQAKYIGYKTTKQYTVVIAQNNTTILNVAMADNSTALTQVDIIEHASRESDKASRSIEKNSDNTMNLVSAMSIAISPDVIISNVLGRVSGISLERGNTGDGQHVIIRGMDKRYNTTLINGVKIPSPDNKNRFVPLDIFPSDLVERVEVSKTLTPDLEADASGGVINLVMKTAPDQLRLDGSVGTGYSQLFIDRHFASFDPTAQNAKAPGEYIAPLAFASPNSFPYQNLVTTNTTAAPNANASLTIGNRFFDKKLGILFSGSYQNTYAGNNTWYAPPVKVPGPAPDPNSQMDASAFESSDVRLYSSRIDRMGLILSTDYRFNKDNDISVFGSYIQLNEHRVRETTHYTYGGYSFQDYHWTNAIDQRTETRSDLQNIYSVIVKGEHKIAEPFKLDWTVTTSQASHNLPDVAEFDVTRKTTPVSPGGTYSPTPGSPGSFTYVAPAIITDTARTASESRVWTRNTDKDVSGYLNLHYNTRLFSRKATVSFGGMFRHKTRANFNDAYSLYPVPDPGSVSGQQNFVSIPASRFGFTPPYNAQGSSFSDAGVYSFYENVQGAYGMLKFQATDKFDLIFGVRAENTFQHYDSSSNPALGGQSANITYTDYLPTINGKYDLTDIQAIRASWNQSIYRPTAADLIPFADVNADGVASTGNPYIQHTLVDNYDLRYEAFPGALDEFMVGGFYKQLTNAIEYQYVTQNASTYISPVNLGTANNYGLELVGKKFFGNFGVSANYTYTHSIITSTKKYTAIGLSTPIFVSQVRPLQGQSANVGNFSFLYKDAKRSLDAQLAFAYTGERINAVSQWKDLDIWEKPTLNLDFSAQKEFKHKYVFFVKVNNILNTPYELFIKQNNANNYSGVMRYFYQESPNYTTVEYDKYYARYNVGFRFKIQ